MWSFGSPPAGPSGWPVLHNGESDFYQIWNPTIFGHPHHPIGTPMPKCRYRPNAHANHVSHSQKFMIQPPSHGKQIIWVQVTFPTDDFPDSLIMNGTCGRPCQQFMYQVVLVWFRFSHFTTEPNQNQTVGTLLWKVSACSHFSNYNDMIQLCGFRELHDMQGHPRVRINAGDLPKSPVGKIRGTWFYRFNVSRLRVTSRSGSAESIQRWSTFFPMASLVPHCFHAV